MPLKHKDTNTTRFLPFADRLSNVNIDVVHQVGHRYEERGEDFELFFRDTLEKWTTLNCTQKWGEFRKNVSDIRTLPQLILLKERVVDELVNQVGNQDPLSLQPILEMIVATAKDLRQEFYPHYPVILQSVVALLSSKDAEILEWSFQCLAHLFKLLWRCMVRNIGPVLRSLIPLLSSKRPTYINHFAADSFAFLARKVRDPKAFLCLVLKEIEAEPESLAGCGRLVFSWIRGVKKQLHSCAGALFPLFLRSLGDDNIQSDLLADLLSHTLEYVALEIRRGGTSEFWSAALATMSQFISEYKSSKSDEDRLKAESKISRLLRLEKQLLEYDEGSHLTDAPNLTTQLTILMSQDPAMSENLLSDIADASTTVLSSSISLPQQNASKLTHALLKLPQTSLLLKVTEDLLDWASFDSLVLPALIGLCGDAISKQGPECLEVTLLAQLIMYKAPPFRDGSSMDHINGYALDFTAVSQRNKAVKDVSTIFLAKISSLSGTKEFSSAFEVLSKILVILPHIRPLKEQEAVPVVVNLANAVLKNLGTRGVDAASNNDDPATKTEEDDKAQLLFLLFTALECLVRLGQNLQDAVAHTVILDVLLPFAKLGDRFLTSLRLLDVYFSGDTLKDWSTEKANDLIERLCECLVQNLSNPYHQVRFLTCRIFSLVPASQDIQAMFNLCLNAVTTEASIAEYRDKLQCLQRLECDRIQTSLLKHPNLIIAPLHLLLGSLYINFKLLWEPVQLIIASYAQTLPVDTFWPVFFSRLSAPPKDVEPAPSKTVLFSCEYLTKRFSDLSEFDDRPDTYNHRLLLWQAAVHFRETCEKRNRDVVTTFLNFVNTEYFKSNADMAYSWNIKQNEYSNESDDESDDSEEEEDEEDEDAPPRKRLRKNSGAEDENDEGNGESTPRKRVRKKARGAKKGGTTEVRPLTRTLQAALTLFSKMRNPRVLYCEPEVKKLYYDFLSHKNDEVQKAALDCILTYRSKSLTPYTERLYSLIDSKKFKNEMTAFRIDKESNMIQAEHRPELIPVVLRIVHSKLSARAGLRTGGKSAAITRRSMIMRFLAGCQEEEMVIFFQMAFRFFEKQLQDDPITMVNKIISSVDLENIVPPRRLQSAINLLSVVLERFGALMGPSLLSLVIKLLLCVGATTTGILNQRENIHAGYLNALKLLRISCLTTLTTFFDRLTAYEWSMEEIDSVFEVFVWPLLPRLTTEGIHSPTALMKLFAVWAQHSRYIPLLGAHAPGDPNLSPLPPLMALMLGAKTNPSVSGSILEMVESLLRLRDHGVKSAEDGQEEMEAEEADDTFGHNEDKAPAIPIRYFVEIDCAEVERLKLSEEINLGSKLLLPHVSAILTRLLSRLSASKPGRGSGLSARELSVLSAASELVRTPESSESLVRLLLPMLSRRATFPAEDDDAVIKMLISLKNLICNVENAAGFIRQLAPLFSVVRGSVARRHLVALTEAVVAASGGLGDAAKFARMAAEFNANDSRWISQPDFDRQLNAYKEAQKLLQEQKMSAEVGALVMHQCFHVAKREKDLSLKDSSGYCMRVVGAGLSLQLKSPAELKYFIDDTVLELIRSGIQSKECAEARERSVLLLGEMARKCGHLHTVLRDCAHFANEGDMEVDMFENLQHLQLYRRNKALLKFSEIARKLENAPTPRTLIQFILPLVSQFLCNDTYVGKNTIIDAAIDATGVICRLLPWKPYEAILRFHLTRLRRNAQYQKQLVRVVASILDAFHFDLSRAKCDEPLPVPDKVAEEIDLIGETEKEKKEDNEGKEDAAAEESNLEEEIRLVLEDDDEEPEEKSKMDVDISKSSGSSLAIQRIVKLSPSAARRVMQTVAAGIFPQLHRVLTARTLMDGVHRFNKKVAAQVHRTQDKDAEEEELLRIPIALAVVKLLQRLPEKMLVTYLPGIFAKLCNYLKSRLESVRRVTRDTMKSIMAALGPSYLPTLLHEMTSMLNRGFFVYVLVYTMHSVIVSLQDLFKPGDMDKCLQDILAVCKVDLFGAAAEDKEEGKVARRVQEARSTKSLDTLHLLARFVTEKCLIDLLVPFKNVLQTAHSHKIVSRVSECLRHIVVGLSENSFITGNALLLFSLGVASESVPVLTIKKKEEKTVAQKERETRRRPDSFLLPEEPKRHIGIKTTDAARTAARMNVHVLIEFGLRLVLVLLKHEQIRGNNEADVPLLNSLVPILNDCVESKHVLLSTLSLQCLRWILKMDLPALKTHIDEIATSIFTLLHKFAAAGLSKGDNFEMVMAAFKTVSVLVRDVKFYTLTTEQLKVLLLYAEQDLADVQRHATAFGLLRAILARKLIVPEIHDVMERVATVSITSPVTHVRVQARNVFHQFLLDYPLGKKLKTHLLFYISQLSYGLQSGRESALEMINTVICTFPPHLLQQNASMMYLALGARLVNDDSPDCRKMAAQCITALLQRLENKDRTALFSVTMVWIKDALPSHRRLAAQLCGLFVESEKDEFSGRLPGLLPEVLAQFSTVTNKKENGLEKNEDEERTKNESERMRDHHVYQVLQLVLKICHHCPDWMSRKDLSSYAANLTEHAQALLCHPHEWVRLAAAEFLTVILNSLDVAALGEAANRSDDSDDHNDKLGYFGTDTRRRVKSLVLDLCAQLDPGNEVREELLMQVVKNLVILADVLKDVKELKKEGDRVDGMSLMWLVRRMRKAVNMEIVKAPQSTAVRTMVLNWAAAVAVKLSREHIQSVLYHLMAPSIREQSLEEVPPEGSPLATLRNLARDVGKIIKRAAGTQLYNTTQSQLRDKITSVQIERRMKRKQEAVNDPERAAKRKIQKQQKKKETKKKKILKFKGKKKFKRKEVNLDK